MKTDSVQPVIQNQPMSSRELTLHQDSLYQAFVLDSLRIEKQNELDQHRVLNAVPDAGMVGVFIPIISIIAVFLFLWRLSENKKKVRIAMIDKGMDPTLLNSPQDESSRKFGALRWGMVLLGTGLGLLIGLVVVRFLRWEDVVGSFLIISCMLLFSGLALVLYNIRASKLEKPDTSRIGHP